MNRTLTDRPKLKNYWVRSLGFSTEFSRIRSFDELTGAEKLLASVLRSDDITAAQILDSQVINFDEFLNLIQRESLGCFVFERLVALGLALRMQSSRDSAAVAAVSAIRMLSFTGAANHYQLEEKFAKVLSATKEFRAQALWVKGAHLSRTIYEPHYLRHYGDLDVIVNPSILEGFVQCLGQVGFKSFHTPAYCNQIGVGPIKTPSDVIIAPVAGWIPTGAITMGRRDDASFVDIKVGPFERGVQAIGFERLFTDAEESSCLGNRYFGPSKVDHLLIMLCNFAKNRFKSWRTLLDIHMLSNELNKSPAMWELLIRTCKKECIATTAWAALAVASDRLATTVPYSVLESLSPAETVFSPLLSFTVDPAYVWNSTSLPMMILNACISSDRQRKIGLLGRSIFPAASFLRKYYGRDGQASGVPITYGSYLLMHWFVLSMPAGFVRRTLGRCWWSSEPNF